MVSDERVSKELLELAEHYTALARTFTLEEREPPARR
jgi:hypothetical protein